MPLNSIVTIVLRLFAVDLLIKALILLPAAIHSASAPWPNETNFLGFGAPIVFLVFAIGLFCWSHLLGRIVTPRSAPEVQLGGLSLYDLYCFAFTFLGLYLALTNVARTLNWLHYYLTLVSDTQAGDQNREQGFYGLAEPLITFLAGLACLLFAPRFARKLASLQCHTDPAAPPPAKPSPE
jgi:hypothetical protein